MKELEKLMQQESDEKVVRDIKFALYLYKDLLTDNNKDILDDYTNALINIFKAKSGVSKEKNFSTDILKKFYYFLIKNGKTEKTAYDYAKRVERICKEFNISINDLFNRISSYSINDLIGMYSKKGIKSEENIARHNAPLSALKQFRVFMNCQDLADNGNEFEDLYLCETEDYQSWEIMDKHPYIIEIKGRRCETTFKERRSICGKVSKIINDTNYAELIRVFRKYKNILSNDTTPSIQRFPYGGSHSFKYAFEGKSNFSGCAALFESNNRTLEEQACEEYHKVIDEIINQW